MRHCTWGIVNQRAPCSFKNTPKNCYCYFKNTECPSCNQTWHDNFLSVLHTDLSYILSSIYRKKYFNARLSWKRWCEDKNYIWQSAMETDLANKWWRTWIMQVQHPLKGLRISGRLKVMAPHRPDVIPPHVNTGHKQKWVISIQFLYCFSALTGALNDLLLHPFLKR